MAQSLQLAFAKVILAETSLGQVLLLPMVQLMPLMKLEQLALKSKNLLVLAARNQSIEITNIPEGFLDLNKDVTELKQRLVATVN